MNLVGLKTLLTKLGIDRRALLRRVVGRFICPDLRLLTLHGITFEHMAEKYREAN